jgi:hypothetical protein
MTFSLQVKSTAIVHALTNSFRLMLELSFSLFKNFSAYLNIIFVETSLYFQLIAINPRAIFLPNIFSISISKGRPSSTSIS